VLAFEQKCLVGLVLARRHSHLSPSLSLSLSLSLFGRPHDSTFFVTLMISLCHHNAEGGTVPTRTLLRTKVVVCSKLQLETIQCVCQGRPLCGTRTTRGVGGLSQLFLITSACFAFVILCVVMEMHVLPSQLPITFPWG
jgi:hypothetical protein